MKRLSEMWKQVKNIFSNEEEYSRLNYLEETFTSFYRTPLHIAVMSGDIKFATQILSQRPDLALKEDAQGYTPLHYASDRTNLQMVRLLLEAKPSACIVQDQNGRTPLHLAAMKNRVEIIKVLMEKGLPEAIHLNQNGETILHFCVKGNTNLKTLKLLARYLVPAQPPYPNYIDYKDNDGNTILHLAAEMGNMKITNYLLFNNNARIDINVVNNKGLRALNMLSQAERIDVEFGFYGLYRVNALLVVATLIAGIAFQAAINPPGGVWQDDAKVSSSTDPVTFANYLYSMYGSSLSGRLKVPNFSSKYEHYDDMYKFVSKLMRLKLSKHYHDMTLDGLMLEDSAFTDAVSNYSNSWNSSNGVSFPYLIRYAGYPILAYKYPTEYVIYMTTNGVAFLVSLTIIFLVVCGFTNGTSVTQVRILVVLMCISIGCIAFACLFVLHAMRPEFYIQEVDVYLVLQIFLGVCCLLGVVWFFIWTAWKIVKLRRRTRHHHVGVINYMKALFFCMDAKAAGKLFLFIFIYSAFRLDAYYNK
ncbi:hypothetical protein MKW98_000921 [Papaver atlanticum]|uniref:PGG domain-containing protein n=1 Tax=Papaver atlanticum TaxID=357466 RepID=A0AAD4XCM5_9MAGN|nr:hypothetical protein MKW98_000921 [Papaver atlanticum]